MRVAVIGAGAYGCYVIDSLIKKFPEIEIVLFEVGDSKIKNEDQIGFKTNLQNLKYSGLSKGRYFGFGGTTSRWGGQLLTFTRNDFKNPTQFLTDIISLNEKYKRHIFKKFKISSELIESEITDQLFIKTGVWLNYFNRNLFNYFKISKRKNVFIHKNTRVIKIIKDDNNGIKGLVYKKNGEEKLSIFNHYFLTAGAFESNRILLNSGFISNKVISFSDHLSQKIFKIKGSTKIGNDDFSFRVNGSSLITKRIIGEINGVSFFANPIFNSEFSFFQNIKQVLFKYKFNFKIIKNIVFDIPSLIKFFWSFFFKKRIYVHRNEWYLFIDVEIPKNNSKISLSDNYDIYNEKILDVDFFFDKKTFDNFNQAKDLIKNYLIKNNVDFEECDSNVQVDKIEDTYHPYAMICNFDSCNDYFNMYKNMLVINTGILPRAGGINPTAAVFPLIEEYINNYIN